MDFIPYPPITSKIGNNHIRKPSRHFTPRIKKVVIEPIVEEERIALDNKFRVIFLSRLFDAKQPNYSHEEILNVLEKER